jgi:hypothetical protein
LARIDLCTLGGDERRVDPAAHITAYDREDPIVRVHTGPPEAQHLDAVVGERGPGGDAGWDVAVFQGPLQELPGVWILETRTGIDLDAGQQVRAGRQLDEAELDADDLGDVEVLGSPSALLGHTKAGSRGRDDRSRERLLARAGLSIRHSTASVQSRVDRSVARIDSAEESLSQRCSWLPPNTRLCTCSSTKGGNSRANPAMVATGVANATSSERQRALPRAA